MSIPMFMPFLPLIPLFTIMFKSKSFMSSIICLESTMLLLVMTTSFMYGTNMMKETYILMMLLSFSASEAAIGLSLLVAIMRSFGNENMNMLTLSKC